MEGPITEGKVASNHGRRQVLKIGGGGGLLTKGVGAGGGVPSHAHKEGVWGSAVSSPMGSGVKLQPLKLFPYILLAKLNIIYRHVIHTCHIDTHIPSSI